MKKLTVEEFEHYYELHQKWLNGEEDGVRLNLYGANLTGYDLSKTNLIRANLYFSNLTNANLTGADLSEANLTYANLYKANITEANLYGADLYKSNLSFANLSEANLYGADLTGADLTNTKGLSSKDWMDKNLEKTNEGYIVYKKIGKDTSYYFKIPRSWVIEKGSYLTEIVSYDRSDDCSFGVNFGTYDWCINYYPESNLWKCLIEFEDVKEVVVPYGSDGKARCGRLKLLENLGRVYK